MSSEKKIIIDEDWKSQVEAEKEEAKRSAATPQTPAGESPGHVGDMPMPPASFEMLVTTLATEALVALGQIKHPVTNELLVHRHQAQYLIDTLDMLKQKTSGNLTDDEREMIDAILYQLRMVFVQVSATGGTPESPPPDHLA